MHAVHPTQVSENAKWMSIPEVLHQIRRMPYAPYITFTGGDPAIWRQLGDLIPALNRDNVRVAVETQGSHFPDWFTDVDVLTFSPKPPSSGNVVDYKDLTQWLVEHVRKDYRGRVCIKVVVFNDEDMEYARAVYSHVPHVLYDAFYFTAGTPGPVGRTAALAPTFRVIDVVESQRLLVDKLLGLARQGSIAIRLNDKTHVGCQQHVLIWPEEDKGV
jgi:7-cyano-7-deazaguanosine (preQ0) biosynthesis protein QueE